MGNTQTRAQPYQLLWISISNKADKKNDSHCLMLRSSFPPSVLVICKCSKCYFLLFIIMVISGCLSISGFINQSVSDICVFNIFVRSRGRVETSPSQSKAAWSHLPCHDMQHQSAPKTDYSGLTTVLNPWRFINHRLDIICSDLVTLISPLDPGSCSLMFDQPWTGGSVWSHLETQSRSHIDLHSCVVLFSNLAPADIGFVPRD